MVSSLQLAHRLFDRNILLVGAGGVALTRLLKLVPTGCKVTLVSPEIHKDIIDKYCSFINDSDATDSINTSWEADRGKQIYRVIKRTFDSSYLSLYKYGNDSGWAFIMTCIPDSELSKYIYHKSKELFGSQLMINVADNPPLCDFYFGANLNLRDKEDDKRDASLQIMISSNGASPRFIALVRDEISILLEDINLMESVTKLGDLRQRIRSRSNNSADLKYRMKWLKTCTDIFGIKYCYLIDVAKVLYLYDEMYKDNKSLNFPSKEKMFEHYLER